MTEQTESAPASGDAEPSSENRKKRLSRREQKARKRQRKQQDPKDSKSNIVRGEKNGEANQPESQPKKSKKKKRKRQQKEDKSGDNHPVKTSLPQPEHPTAPALIPPESENEDAKPLNKRARKKLSKRQKQDEKGATDLPEDPSGDEKKQGITEPESSDSIDEKKEPLKSTEIADVPTNAPTADESDNDGNSKKRLSRRAKKRLLKQQKRQKQQQAAKSLSQDAEQKEEDPKPQAEDQQLNEQSTAKQEKPDDIWKTSPLQKEIQYIPTPIPGMDKDGSNNKQTKKTLGKWFPKASVVKSQPSASSDCTILLFYQYKTPVLWHECKVAQLIRYLQAVAEARPQLGGRLRVAPEGINATLSCGDAPDGTNGRTILEHFTRDLQQFDAVFHETDFKFLPAKADRHFKDLKILPVQELVFYGLQEAQAPLSETGVHLDAKDFHEMLQDTSKDTVVVDVRNHYEAALGRFDGQAKIKGAAQYTDPLMRKSTDFPTWVEKAADDLKGKRVMMYCTGGVRCERASAYLRKTMGDSLDGVYQLQGGIERYLQAYPDGGHWRGSNFVFDKREAVSASNPNGDGGVVAGKKKKRKQLESVETKCCLCDRPWDRYIGKKKCECCGVPVLMCDSCLSSSSNNGAKKKRKSKNGNNNQQQQDEPPKMARCPLCVDQNITVKIEDTEYTDNGVKSKSISDQGKAAPSVLKWGGGHASQKKERRRRSREKAREEAKALSSKA